jgi:hypothetical protein
VAEHLLLIQKNKVDIADDLKLIQKNEANITSHLLLIEKNEASITGEFLENMKGKNQTYQYNFFFSFLDFKTLFFDLIISRH